MLIKRRVTDAKPHAAQPQVIVNNDPYGNLAMLAAPQATTTFEYAIANTASHSRAWTLLQADRLREARAAIEQSLALEPRSPHALGTRCWIRVSLADRDGKVDCEGAIKDRPGNELDRGMLDFLAERYAEAAAAWRREALKDPSDAAFLESWAAKAESAARLSPGAR